MSHSSLRLNYPLTINQFLREFPLITNWHSHYSRVKSGRGLISLTLKYLWLLEVICAQDYCDYSECVERLWGEVGKLLHRNRCMWLCGKAVRGPAEWCLFAHYSERYSTYWMVPRRENSTNKIAECKRQGTGKHLHTNQAGQFYLIICRAWNAWVKSLWNILIGAAREYFLLLMIIVLWFPGSLECLLHHISPLWIYENVLKLSLNHKILTVTYLHTLSSGSWQLGKKFKRYLIQRKKVVTWWVINIFEVLCDPWQNPLHFGLRFSGLESEKTGLSKI